MAVTNQHTGITVFIDETRGSVSGIEYGFDACIFKDGLITACTLEFLGYVNFAFFFGKSFEVVIHDNTLF